MTSPKPLDAMDQQQRQLAGIEQMAQRSALGDLDDQIASLTSGAAAASAASPDAWQTLQRRLDGLLEGVDAQAERVLRSAMGDAWAMGLQHSADQVGLERPLALDPPPFRPGVAELVQAQREGVRAVLRSNEDIPAALAVARRTATRVKAAVAWHVNRAAAEAVEAATEELGLQRRWVAERDGCIHCVAYQGEVALAGGAFPAGLTFGDSPPTREPIPNPPLHPNCRCLVQPHDPRDTEVIAGLKREAKRSVLKGWSLPSESEPARLRAADRLLARGAGLPKTVETAARRAVKRGKFADRDVPNPTPPRRPPPDLDDPPNTATPPPNEPVPPKPRGRGRAPQPPEVDEAGVPNVLTYEYLSSLSPEQEDDLMAHIAARLDDENPVETERWSALERYLDYQDREASYVDDVASSASSDDEVTALVEAFQAKNGVPGLTHPRVGGRGSQPSISTRPSKREVAEDYALLVEERYVMAENATRGQMVNAKGRRRGVNGRDLMSGDIRTVYRYASDELLEWFESNRRVTWSEFYYERTGSPAFRAAAERAALQNARIDRDRKGLR